MELEEQDQTEEDVRAYIGTKIIMAQPQTAHISGRGGVEGYEVVYPDGYRSWSPKAVFENAYRLVTEDEVDLIDTALESDTDATN